MHFIYSGNDFFNKNKQYNWQKDILLKQAEIKALYNTQPCNAVFETTHRALQSIPKTAFLINVLN